MTPRLLHVDDGELPDLVGAGDLPGQAVVVALTGPAPSAAVLAAAARSHHVLIGLGEQPTGPLLDLLTTTLATSGQDLRTVTTDDPDAALAVLAPGAGSQAARVLQVLLRLNQHLDVADALVAESLAYSTLQAGPEHRGWLNARAPRAVLHVDEPVQVRDGDILHARLARPARRNAVVAATREALLDAVDLLLADPLLSLELSGEGPVFSSGGDLDKFGTTQDPTSAHLLRTSRSPAMALHRVRDRVTVRLHGACAGAGVELPAFAGRVVAHPDTTLRLPEVAIGLVPGAGGTVSLPRRIGRWRTAWMALSGQPVDVSTALAWGLVDELG